MIYIISYILYIIGCIAGRFIAIGQDYPNKNEFLIELKKQLKEPITWIVTFLLPVILILILIILRSAFF